MARRLQPSISNAEQPLANGGPRRSFGCIRIGAQRDSSRDPSAVDVGEVVEDRERYKLLHRETFSASLPVECVPDKPVEPQREAATLERTVEVSVGQADGSSLARDHG